jgi:hypothetical protein
MASVRLTLSQANIGALLGDSPTSPVVREVAEIGRDLERTCKRLCPVSKEGNRLDGVYAGQLADAIDIRITTGRVPRAVVSIDRASRAGRQVFRRLPARRRDPPSRLVRPGPSPQQLHARGAGRGHRP